MGANEDMDKREAEIGTGVSLQPIAPIELKFNFRYNGRMLSFNILPNELKIVHYRRFTLMARYYVDENTSVLKWATLDKYGSLIDEGEI